MQDMTIPLIPETLRVCLVSNLLIEDPYSKLQGIFERTGDKPVTGSLRL